MDRIAAEAYAEYCWKVYHTDAKWKDWEALPAYVKRAWRSAISHAIKASNV